VALQTRYSAALLALFLVAVTCMLPHRASAQGVLPTTWVAGPISPVNAIAYTKKGDLLAIGGNNGIQIFTVATGVLLETIPTAARVSCLAFSADGTMLADCAQSTQNANTLGLIQLWNVSSNKLIRAFGTPNNATFSNSIAFSKDGDFLWTEGNGMYDLEQWSISTGANTKTIYVGFAIGCFSLSSDGDTIAVGGYTTSDGGFVQTGQLQLWSLAEGKVIKKLATEGTNVLCVAFNPKGTMLASGGYVDTNTAQHGVLELWSGAGQLVKELPTNFNELESTSRQGVGAVAFSVDGAYLADGCFNELSLGQSNCIELWSVSGQTLLNSFDANSSDVSALAFSPDKETLASGETVFCQGGVFCSEANTWVFLNGELWKSFNPDTENFETVAFSPRGSVVAEGGFAYPAGYDGYENIYAVLELRSPTTGVLMKSLGSANNAGVSGIAFSPDGSTFVDVGSTSIYYGGGPGALEQWNATTGKPIKTLFPGANLNCVAFNSDNSTVAIGGFVGDDPEHRTGVLQLWNINTGRQLVPLATESSFAVNAVAFSPDGKTLLVGGRQGNSPSVGVLELFDVASQKLTKELTTKFAYSVDTVAFSQDGTLFAAGGRTSIDDGHLEIWSASSKSLLFTPKLWSDRPVSSVAFSPYWNVLFAGTGLTEIADDGRFSSVEAISTYDGSRLNYFNNYTLGVGSVAVSPSGLSLAHLDSTTLLDGANPFAIGVAKIVLNPSTVGGGAESEATVTLTGPAPSGGALVTISSNSPDATPQSKTMLIPAGQSSGQEAVTTENVTTTALATITANYGGSSASAVLTLGPIAVTSVVINPNSVPGGTSTAGTVNLNGPAPTGGLTVTLSSGSTNASVPKTLTFAAGASSKGFTITTVPVAMSDNVTITAKLGASTKSATVTVQAPGLAAFTLAPTSVTGGTSTTGTLKLTGPAPTGGETILLSSNTSAAVPPTSVTIPAGASSTTFKVKSVPVASNLAATLTAKLGGVSLSAPLKVLAPTLSSLTVSPNSVQGSSSTVVTGTVTLSGPPTANLTISLTSSMTSAATVPATVKVLAGKTTATFTVSHVKVSSTATVTLTASLANSPSATATLSVTP
jgi:WD40 repeat protein